MRYPVNRHFFREQFLFDLSLFGLPDKDYKREILYLEPILMNKEERKNEDFWVDFCM